MRCKVTIAQLNALAEAAVRLGSIYIKLSHREQDYEALPLASATAVRWLICRHQQLRTRFHDTCSWLALRQNVLRNASKTNECCNTLSHKWRMGYQVLSCLQCCNLRVLGAVDRTTCLTSPIYAGRYGQSGCNLAVSWSAYPPADGSIQASGSGNINMCGSCPSGMNPGESGCR